MMMHCSDQGEPLWILDILLEKRSQTGIWSGTTSYNMQLIFSFKKGWLKILNLQQLNGQIRNMATRPRSDPGMTWTRFKPMNEDLPSKLLLSRPSCAINGNWRLWEKMEKTPLLIDRLGLMFEEMPHRQRYQDMVEFLKEAGDAIRSFHATQAGAWWFTAHINDRHSGYWIRCKRNKPILALNQR